MKTAETQTPKRPTKVEILAVWHYDDGSSVAESLSTSAPLTPVVVDTPPVDEDRVGKIDESGLAAVVPIEHPIAPRPPAPTEEEMFRSFPGLREATQAVRYVRNDRGMSNEEISDVIHASREFLKLDKTPYNKLSVGSISCLLKCTPNFNSRLNRWYPMVSKERKLRAIARALAPLMPRANKVTT